MDPDPEPNPAPDPDPASVTFCVTSVQYRTLNHVLLCEIPIFNAHIRTVYTDSSGYQRKDKV
jgi:hypothetical protein